MFDEQKTSELIERVESFEIDEGNPSLSFERRLARENAWTVGYATRVVQEYKRFAILSVVAGHHVTPSEDVDQAWHLHLTYTKSYWRRFCREALQTELHHNPTRGGSSENTKFVDWYSRTLESYERVFGERPPTDIWPSPAQRFAHAGEGRWIVPSEFFVLPKRSVLATSIAAFAGIIVLTIGGCQPVVGNMLNPFNFNGPAFLMFYFFVSFFGLGFAWLLRMLPSPQPTEQKLNWDDPYLVASLADGNRGAVLAAVASLASRGVLVLDEGSSFLSRSQKISIGNPPADKLTPIEQRVYDEVRDKGSIKPADLIKAGLAEGDPYAEQLQSVGLLTNRSAESWFKRKLPDTIISGVFLIGVIKLIVGWMRGRPIGFLIGMLVAVGVVGAMIRKWSVRTKAGEAKLSELRDKHSELQHLAGDVAVAHCAAMAVGLYGFGSLNEHDQLGGMATMLESQRLPGGSAGADAGGCGDGGGCGGGGCGGCGGCGG